MHSIDKIAKQLSIWQNLTENLRPSALTELSSEFREKMNVLRTHDENIRKSSELLSPYLKSAEKNWNRNEFFKANEDLELFTKELNNIKSDLFAVRNIKFLDSALKQFVDKFSPMDKERIESMWKKKLDKKAGITDWFFRNFTERGRTLKQFIKKFPKTFSNLKVAQKSLIDNAKSLLKNFELQLSKLANYRVKRQVEDYQVTAELLIKQFYKFELSFQKYWEKIVSPLLAQLDEFSLKEEPIPTQTPVDVKKEEKVVESPPAPTPTPIDSLEFGKDPVKIPEDKPSLPPPVTIAPTKIKEEPKEVKTILQEPVIEIEEPAPAKHLSKKELKQLEEEEIEKLRSALEKDKLLKQYDEQKAKEEQAKIDAEIAQKAAIEAEKEAKRKLKEEEKKRLKEELKAKKENKPILSLLELSNKLSDKYKEKK